jgi:hypothetical protein
MTLFLFPPSTQDWLGGGTGARDGADTTEEPDGMDFPEELNRIGAAESD